LFLLRDNLFMIPCFVCLLSVYKLWSSHLDKQNKKSQNGNRTKEKGPRQTPKSN
jgi:hypothetical protein